MVLPHRHRGDFQPDMSTRESRQFKTVCFAIEGMSSFSVSLYSYYIYFLMRDRFGFSGRDNLAFAALNGLIYIFASWQGGRFAQRRGYFNALKFGFSVMILALAAGSLFDSVPGLVLATGCVQRRHVFHLADHRGACERRRGRRRPAAHGRHLQRRLGRHECAGAVQRRHAGGKIRIQNHLFSAHHRCSSPCWPWFSGCKNTRTPPVPAATITAPVPAAVPDPHRPSPAKTRAFLRMAWLANPFAYIAINTFIPVLPSAGRAFSSLADVRGICVFVVVLRAARHIHRAVALDGLALPFSLAGDGVCDAHHFVRGDSHRRRISPCCCWRKSFSARPSA